MKENLFLTITHIKTLLFNKELYNLTSALNVFFFFKANKRISYKIQNSYYALILQC